MRNPEDIDAVPRMENQAGNLPKANTNPRRSVFRRLLQTFKRPKRVYDTYCVQVFVDGDDFATEFLLKK